LRICIAAQVVQSVRLKNHYRLRCIYGVDAIGRSGGTIAGFALAFMPPTTPVPRGFFGPLTSFLRRKRTFSNGVVFPSKLGELDPRRQHKQYRRILMRNRSLKSETVDDFVAVEFPKFQQTSTAFNTSAPSP
jgi:hypothetical protein